MAIKIIKLEDGVSRKVSDSYSVLNLLTANDSNNISLAVSTAENHDEITKTTSDRVYYILEGKLIVNDELIAKKGDVVFVSANTEYNFKGSFKAVLVNSSPFKKVNKSISKL
jgi:ethanolamine utilization protein EutQ (cupin superfamily)